VGDIKLHAMLSEQWLIDLHYNKPLCPTWSPLLEPQDSLQIMIASMSDLCLDLDLCVQLSSRFYLSVIRGQPGHLQNVI